ncbi:Hypothetical predicted protein [Pelobates cultripes]|uniref:Uncharacterized protein n=1 Tax=Pelobates cultripes TaxID=61616 RepID=A0AAD1WLL5_PELCU|nr:Hypothetical predicted protein [Pelobates cultripes]
MDDYLSTPQPLAGTRGSDNMAPVSPGTSSRTGSTHGFPARGSPRDALRQLSADLAVTAANMLTRGDKTELIAELRTAIREEITAVRHDLTVLEQRVDALEVHQLQATQHQQASELAATRQGNIILDLRRQVEDLDNRGRRSNIRVRGIPESDDEAPRELLEGLFAQILGDEATPDFGLERAHRALRAPRKDGQPRDLICCLRSFQLKEALMRAARTQRSIRYMDSQIALYQDLSTHTLDARRALKPITSVLQEKRIPYKWGHPFSLQARVGNQWHILRWPNEVTCFLRSLGLPDIPIQNWILDYPPARPTGPIAPVDILRERGIPGPAQRRGGPVTPEE